MPRQYGGRCEPERPSRTASSCQGTTSGLLFHWDARPRPGRSNGREAGFTARIWRAHPPRPLFNPASVLGSVPKPAVLPAGRLYDPISVSRILARLGSRPARFTTGMSVGFGHQEAIYRRGLVLKRLENCVQLGELQKIVHAFGEVQKLHLPPGRGDSGMRGYQFAEARA